MVGGQGSVRSVVMKGSVERWLEIGEFQTRVKNPNIGVEGNLGLDSPQTSLSVGDGSTLS